MRAYIFTADLFIASTLFLMMLISFSQLYVEKSISASNRVELKELRTYGLLLDVASKEKKGALIGNMELYKLHVCNKNECEKGVITGDYGVWRE